MANKKYELTDITRRLRSGQTLHRIRALRQISEKVVPGTLGGWIQSEANLSQDGDCWVYATSMVYDDAHVSENAKIWDSSKICGQAVVTGDSRVRHSTVQDYATIKDHSSIYSSSISGHVRVSGKTYLDHVKAFDYAKFSDSPSCFHVSVYGYAEIFDQARIDAIPPYNRNYRNGGAEIYGYARIHQNACIKDNAKVFENADIYGHAKIQGNSKIHGNAHICDNAVCKDNADVSGSSLVDGDNVVSGPMADEDYQSSKETFQFGGSVWLLDMDENRNYTITERIFLAQQGDIIISADLFSKPLDLSHYLDLIIRERRSNIQMDYSYKCYLSLEAATYTLFRLTQAGTQK